MPRVLFIAGDGRSGSTILHNVLGQIDGLEAVGELRDIWGRGAIRNVTCGCGAAFRECPFWQRVMARAFGGPDLTHARRMLEFTESVHTRDLPLLSAPFRRRRELDRLRDYLDGLSRLYAAIQQVSGCRVIVDSSKNPAYGYLLRHVAGVETYVVHVVRDAPAVAYAWTKRVESEPGSLMSRKPVARSALGWVARNLMAELFLRGGAAEWTLLRYEDFVARPRDAVVSILRTLDEPVDALPFTSERDVSMDRPSHSVAGNPVRFEVGPVALRADEQWRVALPTRDRRTVNAITWPFRVRYRYLLSG